MEQIVTLGIGGTPATLTPFITTGLEVGTTEPITGLVCVTWTELIPTITFTVEDCD